MPQLSLTDPESRLMKMTEEELIQNISYLQKKYLPGREDLVKLLKKENDAIKFVMTKFYILGE